MTVAPTRLMISSGRMAVDPSSENSKPLAGLRLNATLPATVMRTLSARQVQLAIGGQRVVADTFLPLQPGSQLQLKVVQTDPTPILKVLEAAGPPSSGQPPAMINLSAAGDPFARLSQLMETAASLPNRPDTENSGIARLTRLIGTLALKSAAPDLPLLERLIQDGGMGWEGKLSNALTRDPAGAPEKLRQMAGQDLKAVALQLLAEAAEGGPVREAVERFVEGLETLQTLNRHSFEDAGRFILPLPVLWEEGMQFGQLLLDLNRGAGAGEGPAEKATRVSLLLTLTRLGPLRADFGIWKKTVNGTFGVADAETARLVQNDLPRLERSLHRSGFSAGRIDCRVLGRSTLASTSLAEELLGAGEGGLNLVV